MVTSLILTLAAQAAPADALPRDLLARCDANAAIIQSAAPAILNSVAALERMGVLNRADFDDVKIGFCPLVEAGGPVATTACASDIILLDEKYTRAEQSFVLNATLAHEMKHLMQHRARRARYGAAYCASARYAAEKPQLEIEADAFGDATSALFSQGRPIEVTNGCALPLAIYVEPADPVAIADAAPALSVIAPHQRKELNMRALSSNALFYARTQPASGPAHVFERKSGPHLRFIEGRAYHLREARLSSAGRTDGPFRLRLSCPPAHD
jgi:hypothetical protein